MNQKTGIIVGIVILLLVVVGIGGYLLMRKNPTPAPVIQAPQQQVTQQATPQETQGTLKSLMASGGSVQCSFTNTATDSAKASGTAYISSGKMRGDFAMTVAGATRNSHIIVDGQTSYLWTDGIKQGMKFAMANPQPTTAAGGSNQGVDLNQSVSYSCQPWSADTSMFALPTDVTFMALTVPSTAPSTSGTGTTGVSAQCSACDNIPAGPAKDACKTQLHCP